MLTGTAFGVTMYTVPAEYTVTECEEVIQFEVWIDESGGDQVRSWQVWFDCFGPAPIADPPCAAMGTCDFLPPVHVYDDDPDYIFNGISHGFPPTENNGDCGNVAYNPFTHGARAANYVSVPAQGPVVTTPKYLCTWEFQVSQDACGDFEIDFFCATGDVTYPNPGTGDGLCGAYPRTSIKDLDNNDIPMSTTNLIVHVPCGQCCDGLTCIDEMSECLCDKAGGTWNGSKTCADPCACFSDADCYDSNPCTVDECIATACVYTAVDCSGEGDDCNTASCDTVCDSPVGGLCANEGNCDIMTPLPDDTPCTNDGDPCTEDVCESGVCVHNAIPDCAIVVCLTAETKPDGTPDECLPWPDPVLVRVHIGAASGIVGHQARVEWDPAELTFKGIEPGAVCDDTSEFTGFLNPPVIGDGWVFFAAETGVPVTCVIDEDCPLFPDQTCVAGLCDPMYETSDGDVDTACLWFNMAKCAETEVCFCEYNHGGDAQACNPYKMRIVTDQGMQLPWQDCDPPCATIIADTPIELVCPDDVNVNANCDATTADIYWDGPTAFDQCGVPQITSYTCTPLAGSPACDPNWVMNDGGTFPQGSWLFEACALDKECGDTICCTWTVTVSNQNTLEVEVQLSPVMDPGPFTRCIEFQLWTACTPLIVGPPFYELMTFGGDYNIAGHGAATIKIPKGQYVCIAARDPLHTLRASAMVECDGVVYNAIFKGDPFFGGNWLIGGNLDGLRPKDQGSPFLIDIVDYAIFVSQYLDTVDPNTDCTMLDWLADMHADINGDGYVDDLDFTFISINFLESDKDTCCPDSRSIEPVGLTEVTTRQLRAWGISDKADLNGDGLVNTVDMQLFLGGVLDKGTRSPR